MAVRNPDLGHEASRVSELVARARDLIMRPGEDEQARKGLAYEIRRGVKNLQPATSQGLRTFLGDLITTGSQALDNGFKHQLFSFLFETRSTGWFFDLMTQATALSGKRVRDYTVLELLAQLIEIESRLARGKMAVTPAVLEFITNVERFLKSPAGQRAGQESSLKVLVESRAQLELEIETGNQKRLLGKNLAAEMLRHQAQLKKVCEENERRELETRESEAWQMMSQAPAMIRRVLWLMPRVREREYLTRERLSLWREAVRDLREAHTTRRSHQFIAEKAQAERKGQKRFINSARRWLKQRAKLKSLESKLKFLGSAISELSSLGDRKVELARRATQKRVAGDKPTIDNPTQARLRLAKQYRDEAEVLRRKNRNRQADQLDKLAADYEKEA